jgi:hypothetical protein
VRESRASHSIIGGYSDDTKCESSHKSEVVDQLQADNDDKGNSSQKELRAYLRRAVA